MTPLVIGVLALVFFLVLMVLSIPVPFAMLFAGAVGILAIRTPAVAGQMMVAELYNTFSTYALTVGPMFGLMGFWASYSGIGSKLFTSINYFVGHRRGGLAAATEVACAGFGAICGSPPACMSTMCAVAYPEMRKYKYAPELAGSCIAAGAALSLLIPPSSSLILYGIATETSIGRLFTAGIIPGIMLCALDIVAILWVCWRHPEWASVSERHSWKERFESLTKGGMIEITVVFLLSMGGMFAGFFTPTEAGAIGAFGMLAITALTRQLNWRKFMNALFAGVRLQAMSFMLLSCANVFGKLFSVSGIPLAMGNLVNALEVPRWSIMLIILLIYFLLGMVTDLLSMTLITMPIFFPIVCGTLGYHPIWFGVIITMVISIGALTPPVGTAVFITRGCISFDKEATLTRLFRGVWPFVVAETAATLIMLVFPGIVTWLPALIYD